MIEEPNVPTDARRAEDHYLHRGDDERWEEPVEARGPSQLSVMVSARFSRSEADRLAAAAAAAGMSRSAFVRQAALSATTGRAVDVARVRREVDAAERRLASARKALG
ncbi:MAG: plasmid mobilization protein [Acidimicrobiales bacterium]